VVETRLPVEGLGEMDGFEIRRPSCAPAQQWMVASAVINGSQRSIQADGVVDSGAGRGLEPVKNARRKLERTGGK
jgi:hypothetical protein